MRKLITSIIACILAALALCGCGSPQPAPEPGSETLLEVESSLAEDISRIQNPDIGFYRTVSAKLTPDGGTSSGLYDGYQLHHLRVNIGDFSAANNGGADMELTPAALKKLDDVLVSLEAKHKSAVIRFAYDGFNGYADREPSEDMLLRHVAQICEVLSGHNAALTAIEAGMVGKWAEMHSSKLANYDTIDKIIDAFLDGTKLPVLVRTPAMIYHYLGITRADIASYTVKPTDKAYRLGLFNDGYLGSGSDLGTYTDRAAETDWLANVTDHLPYGGEVMNTDMASIDNCLPEMYKLHLSYLNYEWNNNTTQGKWANEQYGSKHGTQSAYYGQTAQLFIENHLGYRLVVRGVRARRDGDEICVTVDIKNVGFGNLPAGYAAELVIDDNAAPISGFTGNGEYTASCKVTGEGEKKIYMRVKKAEGYNVRFANVGMYDEALGANMIGKVRI